MSTRLVVDGTLRRVHTTGGRPSATDLDSAASFFAFVANRAGLQNTAAATSLLSDYAQVLGHDTRALTEDHENQGLAIAASFELERKGRIITQTARLID